MTAIRQTLELPSLSLSYLEWGQGEPVLLLHGLVDHAGIWGRLGEHLSDRYHVIAPDLRGHGESGKPATGYRAPEMIGDLEALMAHKGWRSSHILAHSWAGKLVCYWATQQPDRFRSLILVDPYFLNRMPGYLKLTFPLLYRLLPFLKLMGPFPTYEAAERVARKLKQYQGWSPFQEEVFRASIEQKPDGRWGSKFVVPARNEVFDDVMRFAGLTEPLQTPALLIKPVGGLNQSDRFLNPYKTYLTNLQVTEVPGNHWPFLVEPEAFNQAVSDFLDQQSQPTH